MYICNKLCAALQQQTVFKQRSRKKFWIACRKSVQQQWSLTHGIFPSHVSIWSTVLVTSTTGSCTAYSYSTYNVDVTVLLVFPQVLKITCFKCWHVGEICNSVMIAFCHIIYGFLSRLPLFSLSFYLPLLYLHIDAGRLCRVNGL